MRVSAHWSKPHQSHSIKETEVIFHSPLLILVTLARCGSWHPQGHNALTYNRCTLLCKQTGLDIFYSNTFSPSMPLFTRPDLFVTWRCLSLRFYLWVSVCLTLVWLGQVLPWSHQSPGGPVKAISPSCTVNLCQLCACVSSLTEVRPHSPNSRTCWAMATHLLQADCCIYMSINHSWN